MLCSSQPSSEPQPWATWPGDLGLVGGGLGVTSESPSGHKPLPNEPRSNPKRGLAPLKVEREGITHSLKDGDTLGILRPKPTGVAPALRAKKATKRHGPQTHEYHPWLHAAVPCHWTRFQMQRPNAPSGGHRTECSDSCPLVCHVLAKEAHVCPRRRRARGQPSEQLSSAQAQNSPESSRGAANEEVTLSTEEIKPSSYY